MQTDDRLIQALNQYEKLIYSICYQMTRNYFDAQDLTQETFLAYYKALPDFDGMNEKGFLTRIATNKCLDYLRQAERRTSPATLQDLEAGAASFPPAEETVMESLVMRHLKELCQSLKQPYNEVALAYYYNNQTARQIAQTNGKNLKTIQTQVARAKKMLQKLWKKEELL